MTKTALMAASCSVLAWTMACGDASSKKLDAGIAADSSGSGGSAGGKTAVAVIMPVVVDPDASVNTVTGTANFSQDGNTVRLSVSLSNCPGGEHGIHIFDSPQCSAGAPPTSDAARAARFWDPDTTGVHGKIGVTSSFRLGNIGNITCANNGSGALTFSTSFWTVNAGKPKSDVDKHSLVIFANRDDSQTQMPCCGGMGETIGCGSIELR